jgi:hypothetical protein
VVALVPHMLDKLGLSGILGLVVLAAGIAIVAIKAPIVALGLVLVLIGLGLVVRSLAKSLMGVFGL